MKLELTKYEAVALRDLVSKFTSWQDCENPSFEKAIKRIEKKLIGLLN